MDIVGPYEPVDTTPSSTVVLSELSVVLALFFALPAILAMLTVVCLCVLRMISNAKVAPMNHAKAPVMSPFPNDYDIRYLYAHDAARVHQYYEV